MAAREDPYKMCSILPPLPTGDASFSQNQEARLRKLIIDRHKQLCDKKKAKERGKSLVSYRPSSIKPEQDIFLKLLELQNTVNGRIHTAADFATWKTTLARMSAELLNPRGYRDALSRTILRDNNAMTVAAKKEQTSAVPTTTTAVPVIKIEDQPARKVHQVWRYDGVLPVDLMDMAFQNILAGLEHDSSKFVLAAERVIKAKRLPISIVHAGSSIVLSASSKKI